MAMRLSSERRAKAFINNQDLRSVPRGTYFSFCYLFPPFSLCVNSGCAVENALSGRSPVCVCVWVIIKPAILLQCMCCAEISSGKKLCNALAECRGNSAVKRHIAAVTLFS